ncbi:MAG: Hsp70 family protein [Limnothrix sp.]|nr:Hsp70 family protein [Limnothrix sp.]
MTIAIDFGTSNTVVTYLNPVTGNPETLDLSGLSVRQSPNPPLIPSLLYVAQAAEGQVVAGQAVRDRGLDQLADGRLFRGFKRGIGTAVQGFVPELDGRSVDFEQAGQWFLDAIARALTAQQFLGGAGAGSQLILTVPVDSFEQYRNWLTRAIAQSALGQIEQVRLLDEPTAAALGYGAGDRDLVLVVDFGGGTLDLSLVRLDRPSATSAGRPLGFLLKWGNRAIEDSQQTVKTARVLAKAGLNLGGSDLDNWIVDYWSQQQSAVDLPGNALGNSSGNLAGHSFQKTPILLRLAERVKIALSHQETAQEVYFDDATFNSLELSLSRTELETILRDRGLFQQLDRALDQIFQQAIRQGLEPQSIEAVLLVGGTSQIPAIQSWIRNYFPAEKVATDRPFEAIAQGALKLASGLEVRDFLYHGYGIRYWNQREKRHSWHPIIPKGQPYPTAKPVELLLGASIENQPQIELILGELGDEEQRTEIFFDGDRLVTKTIGGQASVQPLNDRDGARSLAQLDPPGMPGIDRIRVVFEVDADRTLRVTVEDLLSDRTLLNQCPIAQLS